MQMIKDIKFKIIKYIRYYFFKSRVIPKDFDIKTYLWLNPDLENKKINLKKHYGLNGIYENRVYSKNSLPKNFNPKEYLYFNSDLEKLELNPSLHYKIHGINEGRFYSIFQNINKIEDIFEESKETVIVVSHEASRTGAPALSLNITKELINKYNVICILLGGGALLNDFKNSGALVIEGGRFLYEPESLHKIVSSILENFKIKYAIINSAQCREIVKPLSENSVYTLFLIHEFLSCYLEPEKIFIDSIKYANNIVFSADITYKDALTYFPSLLKKNVDIFPQGRCILSPIDYKYNQNLLIENKIDVDFTNEDIIVLGLGTVDYRKGVDIFINVAFKISQKFTDKNLKFIWLGDGFNPKNDPKYSVFLADQIRRSGLQDKLFFLGAVDNLDYFYKISKILLLTSRLDPLPNVAIDGMDCKLPIVCFDDATGIAQYLKIFGVEDYCVSKYLDFDDMANKAIYLIESKEINNFIATTVFEQAKMVFNMKNYVERLDLIVTN